jgi:YidC/Oxa1 family membrane protein insertase
MATMSALFSTIIYRPILNLTVLLYGTVGFGDLGIAIIAMTLAIRLALSPLSIKTARSQKALAGLSPELEAIKERYKGDNSAQSEAIMKLYRERGVNPLAGCLPMLIQLPVLFGMYRVFLNVFKPGALDLLYTFIPHPAAINHSFLGFLDISVPSHILAITAGILQFVQAKYTAASQPATSQTAALNTQMMYLFPVMIVVISWNLPAGLALYWVTTTLFSIGEQLYLRWR